MNRSIPFPARCRLRGVTLVEILVCMVIVVILMAILLPVTSSVRTSSENSRCITHLRALGAAIGTYTADNGGFMPPGWSPSEGTMVTALEPYIGPMKEPHVAADTFYCPTNERLGSPPKEGYPRGAYQRYKGYGGYFIGYLINASVHPIKGLAEPGEPPPRHRLRFTEVMRPGRTVALLDMVTRNPSVTAPPTSGFASGSYFNPASASFSVGMIHRGRGNILFVDGHVESFHGKSPLSVQSLPNRDTTWF